MRLQNHFTKTLLLAGALLCSGSLAAQGMPSLFGKGRANNPSRSAAIPTTVTATTMDIDLGHNLATLLGSVFVDDQDMTIRCNKMLIYFEDEKEEKDLEKEKKAPATKANSAAGQKISAAVPADEKNKPAQDDLTGGKKHPVRIECFGDVVITAKPKPDEKEPKEQKAIAGKAVYDLVKDEIDLTEKPVIYDGASKIKGTKIKVIVNEDRMLVFQGSATSQDGLPGGLNSKQR